MGNWRKRLGIYESIYSAYFGKTKSLRPHRLNLGRKWVKNTRSCSKSACNTHGGFHFCGRGRVKVSDTFSYWRLGHLLSRSVRRSVFICGSVRTLASGRQSRGTRTFLHGNTVVGYSRVCLFFVLLFPRRSKPKHNNNCPEGLTRRERPSAHLYYTRRVMFATYAIDFFKVIYMYIYIYMTLI